MAACHAEDSEYDTFGVQNGANNDGAECWCGTHARLRLSVGGPATGCTSPCPGMRLRCAAGEGTLMSLYAMRCTRRPVEVLASLRLQTLTRTAWPPVGQTSTPWPPPHVASPPRATTRVPRHREPWSGSHVALVVVVSVLILVGVIAASVLLCVKFGKEPALAYPYNVEMGVVPRYRPARVFHTYDS